MAKKIFLDTKNCDQSVAPGEDFYRYATGGWIKRNPIPADRAMWSSFHKLRADGEKKTRALITALCTKKRLTRREQMVADFYASGLHAVRNRRGAQPVADLLAHIDAIATPADEARAVAALQRAGVSVLFAPMVEPDEKRTDRMALYLYQGGLTLPERTYYLDRSADYAKVRTAYRAHFGAMHAHLPVVGTPAAQRAVLRVERFLAQHAWERVKLRDAHKNYNKVTRRELDALTGGVFDWAAWAREGGITLPRTLIVGQPSYLRALRGLWRTTTLTQRKHYYRWRVVTALAPYLSEQIAQTHFDFFDVVFGGVKKMRPRWQRVLDVLDAQIGEAVGALFCAAYFPPAAKRHAEAMTQEIIATFGARIKRLAWMEAATKRRALAKLRAITVKIGYPDKPETYEGLVIDARDFFGNVMRARAWHWADAMRRIGTPTDRTRWEMNAHTVNAYYHPSHNEIVFPAGILQPPFFHKDYDDAINFGGIGTVIAHEITHGFDDQGSHYDARGNLRDWWTPTDRRKFRALTKKVIAQFDAFEALPGLCVNGALTVGENIADLGGLMVALEAFLARCKKCSAQGPDGLTPVQRFFCAYALTEAGTIRDALLRQLIVTDPHAPGRFRVNGPVVHLQAFYDAFDIAPDAPLYRVPRQRIVIW